MSNTLILAAGGIIVKKTSDGLKIAVIYRTRYGGEWGRPKGKLKKGESPMEAALREVKEETGFSVTVKGFGGCTNYYHDDKPKSVFYWRMELKGEDRFQASEEVQKLEWLSIEETINRLKHEDEKKLIRQGFYCGLALSERGIFERIKYQCARLSRSRQWCRLASAITVYRIDLSRRICENKNPQINKSWIEAALSALCHAEQALYKGNIDMGWKFFHAATRVEIFGYDDNELKNTAAALRHEAEKKLSSWRRKATFEIIANPNDTSKTQSTVLDKESVFLATFLRDEHFNNTYHKIGLRRSNLLKLFIVLFLGVIAFPILAGTGFLPEKIGEWKIIVAVELFGILGASLSVAITLTRKSIDSKIPEQVIGSFVTWMRPAIGAIAAVTAYVFLQTGIIDNIFSSSLTSSSEGILTIAFVAGFSERIFMRMVESVSS